MTPFVAPSLIRSGLWSKRPVLLAALFLFLVPSGPVRSQTFVSNAPDMQRNAMQAVRTQADFLRNTTRVAASYQGAAVPTLGDQFQSLVRQYNSFVTTLSPRQQADFANEWSELSAGLEIIQEAFGNYQQDLANGRSSAVALSDLCRVLSEASRVWLRQFNATASLARVGW